MNISAELREFRERATDRAGAQDFQGALFMSVMASFGIVGNSILIDVYAHTKKKILYTYFILIQGIVDLNICAAILPLRVVILFIPVPVGVCGLYLSSAYASVSCSIYIFLLIAIDRYQSVCRLGKPLFTSDHLRRILLNMAISNIGMAVIAITYLRGDVDIVDGNKTVSVMMREDFQCYVNAMLNHPQRKWDARYILHFTLLVMYTTYIIIVSCLYFRVFKTLKRVDDFRARSRRVAIGPWKEEHMSELINNPTRLVARPCFHLHVNSLAMPREDQNTQILPPIQTAPFVENNFSQVTNTIKKVARIPVVAKYNKEEENQVENKIESNNDESNIYIDHSSDIHYLSQESSDSSVNKSLSLEISEPKLFEIDCCTEFQHKSYNKNTKPNIILVQAFHERSFDESRLMNTSEVDRSLKAYNEIGDNLRQSSSLISENIHNPTLSTEIQDKYSEVRNLQLKKQNHCIVSSKENNKEKIDTHNNLKESINENISIVSLVNEKGNGNPSQTKSINKKISTKKKCIFRKKALTFKANEKRTAVLSKRQKKKKKSLEKNEVDLEISVISGDSIQTYADNFLTDSNCCDEETKTSTKYVTHESIKDDITIQVTNREDEKHRRNVWATKTSSHMYATNCMSFTTLKTSLSSMVNKATSFKDRPLTESPHTMTINKDNSPSKTKIPLPKLNNSDSCHTKLDLTKDGYDKRGSIQQQQYVVRTPTYRPPLSAMSVKIVSRLFLVTLFHYLCWLPFYLIEMGVVSYDAVLLNTFFIANIANPLIHFTTSGPFRREFVIRLKSLLAKPVSKQRSTKIIR